ncbi:MAG: aldo/keto reductase, partial [Erysipelotrichaceae bacterium]|nr:aldo/keto reductase [Erysipelotrichaceae bacterium]
MIKVKLNNGVEMPIIGLGSYKATDFEQAKNAVVYALHNGYRHLDTAAFYRNEDIIAAAIKESGIPRDEIVMDYLKTNEYLEQDLLFLTDYVKKKSGIENELADEAL